MKIIKLTGETLTFEDVVNVALHNFAVEIDASNLARSRDFILQKVSEGAVIYGVTTGFGANVDKVIEERHAKQLQVNLLRSHACGVGKTFPKHIVRAIMLIRLNTLLKGRSGIKVDTAERLRDFLNKQIHPLIPEQGSVGASGDLCPLSHMALPLIGEGYVEFEGRERETAKVLAELGVEPIELSYKEGLALNNGTTVMAALGVFAIYEFERLLKLATLSSCLMFEGLCARREAFDEKIHLARNNKAQIKVAEWIRKLTAGSTFIGVKKEDLENHGLSDDEKRELLEFEIKGNPLTQEEKAKLKELKAKEKIGNLAKLKGKPQDSYSIRCVPQVFGASLQALWHAQEIFADEINAAVDNPLIFAEEGEVLSGGNFHGQPLAIVLDYLKVAIAEIGNITERQINKLVDGNTNDGLEPFLIYDENNINSGLMIPQYAAAAIVSENKVLVHPASADSIPTCANVEDHVSMGIIAARQALEILGNVKKIMAIALLTGHHAAEIRKRQFDGRDLPARMAKATQSLFKAVKETVPDFKKAEFLNNDRFLYNDIRQMLDNYEQFAILAENTIKSE